VARLLPPESSSPDVVSREVGVGVETLERWRAQALATAAGARPGTGSQRWTAAARLEAVITTAAMDEATRSAWCREQGLYPTELDGWKRDAISGLGEPRGASVVDIRQDRRRIAAAAPVRPIRPDLPRLPWTGYATFAACRSAWSGVR
jgi:transposase